MAGNRTKKKAKNRSKFHQARVRGTTRRHKKSIRRSKRGAR